MAAKSNKRPKATGSSKKKGTTKKTTENAVVREEILMLISLAVCVFLLISNFGLGGLVGKLISSVMFGVFGWMAYPAPILLFCAIVLLF